MGAQAASTACGCGCGPRFTAGDGPETKRHPATTNQTRFASAPALPACSLHFKHDLQGQGPNHRSATRDETIHPPTDPSCEQSRASSATRPWQQPAPHQDSSAAVIRAARHAVIRAEARQRKAGQSKAGQSGRAIRDSAAPRARARDMQARPSQTRDRNQAVIYWYLATWRLLALALALARSGGEGGECTRRCRGPVSERPSSAAAPDIRPASRLGSVCGLRAAGCGGGGRGGAHDTRR